MVRTMHRLISNTNALKQIKLENSNSSNVIYGCCDPLDHKGLGYIFGWFSKVNKAASWGDLMTVLQNQVTLLESFKLVILKTKVLDARVRFIVMDQYEQDLKHVES